MMTGPIAFALAEAIDEQLALFRHDCWH